MKLAVLFCCFLCSILVSGQGKAAQRIVTLAPHLTEWIYSLNAQDRLVGVSAYSDYPTEATLLPEVADYQGVDFARLIALEPDLILAWGGGNKPQDIARLKSLGFNVYTSQPVTLSDIGKEILAVADLIDTRQQAERVVAAYEKSIVQLREQYLSAQNVQVFYYMWSQPLMTIGETAWANKILDVCHAESIFKDSPIEYPQVSVKQVIVRQPQLLIAASNQSPESSESFWLPHREVLMAPLISADANALHRFSLRIVSAIDDLCVKIEVFRQTQKQE